MKIKTRCPHYPILDELIEGALAENKRARLGAYLRLRALVYRYDLAVLEAGYLPEKKCIYARVARERPDGTIHPLGIFHIYVRE